MNAKNIAIVIAIVVAVNVISYVVATRALARSALVADDGPTGRRR